MPLNIKDPNTEKVVRELAAITGEAVTDLHPVWRTPLLAHAAKAVTSNWAGLR